MIVFDLRCGGETAHIFEAWFGSSEDYEDQRRRNLVACPVCGDQTVEKAVMAPRLGGVGSGIDTEQAKALLAGLAAAQREIVSKSENVGSRFAEEARAIHLGEADARSIHGQATRAEAKKLVEEGVPVAPLPFPVAAPNEIN